MPWWWWKYCVTAWPNPQVTKTKRESILNEIFPICQVWETAHSDIFWQSSVTDFLVAKPRLAFKPLVAKPSLYFDLTLNNFCQKSKVPKGCIAVLTEVTWGLWHAVWLCGFGEIYIWCVVDGGGYSNNKKRNERWKTHRSFLLRGKYNLEIANRCRLAHFLCCWSALKHCFLSSNTFLFETWEI